MPSDSARSNMRMWLSDPLPDDVRASLQRLAQSDDIHHVAVMSDVHLAGDVCNGTVIATRDLVYPRAVGSDIGCGMLAVALELEAEVLASEQEAGRVLKGLYERVPSNKHPKSNCLENLPELLLTKSLSETSLDKQKHRDGLLQLGTLGRGNHFVEFQSDGERRLWLMVHSGSRAMGQAITDHHQRAAEASESGIGFLDAATSAGLAYLSDVEWGIEYAKQNRLAMARAVESLMQVLFDAAIDWSTLIHCHHNHVQREAHFGELFWVHRKGALAAAENEPGVIPGSMGTCSYHVTGRGHAGALHSSSHGAGRAMARAVASQRVLRHDFQRQMREVWYDHRRIDGLRDEAPAAYKDIGRVMRAQRDLTRIVRQLRPILVYKGT